MRARAGAGAAAEYCALHCDISPKAQSAPESRESGRPSVRPDWLQNERSASSSSPPVLQSSSPPFLPLPFSLPPVSLPLQQKYIISFLHPPQHDIRPPSLPPSLPDCTDEQAGERGNRWRDDDCLLSEGRTGKRERERKKAAHLDFAAAAAALSARAVISGPNRSSGVRAR